MRAFAEALEMTPCALAENSGLNAIAEVSAVMAAQAREEEREAKRQRRVQANRESARQTIRRKHEQYVLLLHVREDIWMKLHGDGGFIDMNQIKDVQEVIQHL